MGPENNEKNEIYDKSIDSNLLSLSTKINENFGDFDGNGLSFIVEKNDDGVKTFKAEVKGEIFDFSLSEEQLIKVLRLTFKVLSNYYSNKNTNEKFYYDHTIFSNKFKPIKRILLDDSIINDTDYVTYEKVESLLQKEGSEMYTDDSNKKSDEFIIKYTDFLNKITPVKKINIINEDGITNEMVNLDLDKFSGFSLSDIKDLINNDSDNREVNSLTFLKDVISNGYEVKFGDTLNFIKNFTPNSMNVNIEYSQIQVGDKIEFILNGKEVDIKNNNQIAASISLQNHQIALLK